jgi:predicted outer membrane protein
MPIIVAALLVAPWVTVSAQDTTRIQDSTKQRTEYNQNQSNQDQYNQNPQDMQPQSDEAILMKLHRINQHEIKMAKLAQQKGTAKVKSFAARLVRDHTANDQKVTALARSMGVSVGQGSEWMDTTGNRRDGHDGMGRVGRSDSTSYPQTYRQGDDSTRRNDSTYRQGYNYNQPDSMQRGQMQGADTTKRWGHDDGAEAARRLQTLQGAAFDTAFANLMVQGHEKALSMLERAQGSSQNQGQYQNPSQNQSQNQGQGYQVQNAQLRTLIANTIPTIRQHLQIAQSLGGTAATTSSSQQ